MAIENLNSIVRQKTTNPSYSKNEIESLYHDLYKNSINFIKNKTKFSKNYVDDFKYFLISFFNLEEDNKGLYFSGVQHFNGDMINFEIFRGEGLLFFKKEIDTGFISIQYSQLSECESQKNKDDYIESLNQNVNHKKKELKSTMKSFFHDKTPVSSDFYCFVYDEYLISSDDENTKTYKNKTLVAEFFPINFDKVFALAIFSFLTQHCLNKRFDYSVFEFLFDNLKHTLYFQDNIFSGFEWSLRIEEFKKVFSYIEVDENGLLTEDSKNFLELNFSY